MASSNADLVELTLNSPAKINVFLEVLGKRNDGFHELETVMLQTSFCDHMHFRASREAEIELTLSPDSDAEAAAAFPLDGSNLIIRAARLLQQDAGCTSGVRIEVQKRIPAEAGLAGGSSNAATTLLGLNRMWNLGYQTSQLHQLAAQLGSDINFFIEGCRAGVCRGRGEQVEAVPESLLLHIVAARPAQGNSTPSVFSQTTLPTVESQKTAAPLLAALQSSDYQLVEQHTFNRLTKAACVSNPGMQQLLTLIESQFGCPAFMSGSGSTCFFYAPTKELAIENARRLKELGVPFSAAMQC